MRYLSLLTLISLCVSVGFSQSGRRIKPTPTPVVERSDEVTFSESTPKPKRPVWLPPSRRAQQSGVITTKPIADTTSDGEDGEVKVETTLVTIPVSVFDRNGLYIPNLNQSNFKIFEDGKEQEIAYFGTSDKPFTVALVIDTSPSTEYKIDEIREAAIAFVDQLKPQDRVMVIEFDGNVQLLTEPTTDRQVIYKGIRKADFGGGTALYEAVDFSLRKRLNQIEGRKAIVLFTDGVDTVSRKASYDSTLALAEESDTLIFPIYYNTYFDTGRQNSTIFNPFPGTVWGGSIGSPVGSRPEDYALGRKYLEELADYTGGRVFRPESTPGGLARAFEGIAEELRRQYQIGYVPGDDGKPGQRKQIKVRVDRPNLVVRSRDSYIVGEQAKTPTAAAAQPVKSKSN
jgi:Ca-activated chloride channel family protein